MNHQYRKFALQVVVAATVVFLVSAAVFAETGNRAEELGYKSGAFDDEAGVRHESSFNRHRNWRVRCDRGQRLSRALERSREGDTIYFSGTCYESIIVTKDRLTVRGSGGATIDGSHLPSEAVVKIDGARNVLLEDFIVQNGSDQGILATHQVQAVMKNLTVTGNGTVGLSIDRSHVDIENLVLDKNTTGGMDAYTASTVVAKGIISASGNQGDGLAVNGKSFLELRGATVNASQNAGSGVSIINDSRLQIFSFPEAQGSTITADDNGFAGIAVLGSELGVVGSQYFGSGANVLRANNNSIFGFFVPSGAILSPHATARFVAQGNAVGMLYEDGGSALIVGGLDLTANGVGISANGAGTLTLVSVPPNPSSVDANQVDLDLQFGTRVTVDGFAPSTVACDTSVLLRGAICP